MLSLTQFTKKFALPLWPWYLTGLIFLALTNIITITIPSYVKEIVNHLETISDLGILKPLAIKIVVLGLTLIIARSLSRILIFWPGRAIEATAKTYYFQKTIRLPQKFFLKYGMGDLISRLSNDLGHVRVLYAFGILQLSNLIFLLLFTVSKMISIHVNLTFLCLFPLFSILVLSKYVLPKMQKYSKLNQEAIGTLTTKVTEAFVNVHTIQANAKEAPFISQADEANQEVFSTNMKLIAIRTLFFPLLATLTHFSQIIALFYGGYEVTMGRLTIGDILAFNIYLATLSFPLTFLGIVINIFQRSKTAMERLNVFEKTEEEGPILLSENNEKKTNNLEKDSPILEIKNLSFSYERKGPKKSPEILSNINLEVGKNDLIGIYGPVGCGKTTLLNLITRIYSPPENTIFFKGKDILSLSPTKLREEVGYALQSSQLFSDTITNNLKLGNTRSVREEDIIEATKKANIYNEIERFSNKWDTQIGEKGIRLSGGQKQRLSLARLFLRSPSIFLLDDVLSAVDQETAAKLINHIKNINQAALLVSHRFSSLKNCNKILLMEKGLIKDCGTYQELMTKYNELK